MNNNKILNDFHTQIEEKCDGKIQKLITDELYKIINSWQLIHGEPAYIIGLSEDHWDYYYMYINNKERKINFMTCLYKMNPAYSISKNWNTDEKKMIKEYVNDYFEEHKNEKLIYFNI